ncbi:MAG TPA: VWA domain-containing protein [Clostridiales bacterium]|nr:VWA domain-containing protein [Clostridiales bacterium]
MLDMDMDTNMDMDMLDLKDKFVMFIINFASFLRKCNFSIAPSAVIDFFTICPQYDIFQYEEMLITIRSLFAKSQNEYTNFEILLQAYLYEIIDDRTSDYVKKKAHEVNALLEELKRQKHSNISIKTRTTKEDKLLAQQADENKEAIVKILQDSGTVEILPVIMLKEMEIVQLLASSSQEKVKSKLNQAIMFNIMYQNNALFNQLCIKGAKLFTKLNTKVQKEITVRQRKITELEKLSTYTHRKDFIYGSRAVRTVYDIMDKPITDLGEDEYAQLVQYIKQNAAKFRTRISRNMKVSKRKIFDFKHTIEKSIETYGEPVRLYYKKPQIKKTRIVCIADISGSVKQYIKLMLQLVYEISSVFKGGVRSYAFVGNLYNITEYMTRYPLEKGIMLASQQATREYSNYDKAFGIFVEDYIGFLDKHTIVLIIGDARNNRNDAGINYLKQIKNRSKSIIWLNPEEKLKWNTGDSIIGKYKPIVNAVYQTNTFKEIIEFLDHFHL